MPKQTREVKFTILYLRTVVDDSSDDSNEPCTTYVRSGSNEIDDFPTLEELLSNAGAVQESERAGLSGEYVTENLEDVIQNDCDGDTHPEPRRGEITGRYVDSAYR